MVRRIGARRPTSRQRAASRRNAKKAHVSRVGLRGTRYKPRKPYWWATR